MEICPAVRLRADRLNPAPAASMTGARGKRAHLWDRLPRFVWGEATDPKSGDGLDERMFLTHARYPRFVCEIYETDEMPEVDSLDDTLVGVFGQRNGERVWSCNAGFFAARWVYIDAVPSDDELHAAMMDAAIDYQLWNDAQGIGP